MTAEGDDHDGGDNSDVLGAEHVDMFVNHDGDTLGSDCAEEVDFQAADDTDRNRIDGFH